MRRCAESGGHRGHGQKGRATQRGPPPPGRSGPGRSTNVASAIGISKGGSDAVRFTMITVIVMVSHYPGVVVGDHGKANGGLVDEHHWGSCSGGGERRAPPAGDRWLT